MSGRRSVVLLMVLSAGLVGCGEGAAGGARVIDGQSTAGLGCSIATDGDQVVIAYLGPFGTGGVYLARSSDGGATFDPGRTVLVDAEGEQGTSVAVVGTTIYVAYVASNSDVHAQVRVARSDDAGATFVAHPISEGGILPSLSVSGDAVSLAYQQQLSAESGQVTESQVRFTRSVDRGMTWSPAPPIDYVSPARPYYVSIAAANGVLFIAYFDGLHGEHKTAHSADDGQTWTVESGESVLLEPTGPLVTTPDEILIPLVDQQGGLFVSGSMDWGASWRRRSFDVPGAFANAFDGNAPSVQGARVAVARDTTYALFRRQLDGKPVRMGVARSADRGVTWLPADVVVAQTSGGYGSPSPADVADAAIAVAGSSVLIVFFDAFTSHLLTLRSTDGGTTWR